MRQGILAFMSPVMTSTEGRWVAMILVHPAFDNLDTVEVGVVRIAQRANHECGNPALGCIFQVATHGDATSISLFGKVRTFYFISFEVPTGKDAHSYP